MLPAGLDLQTRDKFALDDEPHALLAITGNVTTGKACGSINGLRC